MTSRRDALVAASVGIAFSGTEDGVEELMRNADVAMYAAKSGGKGRYVVFEATMQHAASERREMEAELDTALREGSSCSTTSRSSSCIPATCSASKP